MLSVLEQRIQQLMSLSRILVLLSSFFFNQGKDRFPYPVGYKAVRTQNENTFYMEIEEGAKGPLFLVRC